MKCAHYTSAFADQNGAETGNEINGLYSGNGNDASASSAFETNTYAAGSAVFNENLAESSTVAQVGNSVTGDYTRTESNGVRKSSLLDTTIAGTDIYTVIQGSIGTFSRTASGNTVTGAYTKSETAADNYTMNETGAGSKNFALHQAGTNTYTDGETGNTVTGLYTRTKTGNDSYNIAESGVKTGGTYSEIVTGTDNYTLTDNGNLGTGTYTRTIGGTGTYTRTDVGLGATLPSGSGSISYTWTQTGTTRYDLLEDFKDVSNTQAGQTPGHMNIYPFGQAFVDPTLDELRVQVLALEMRIGGLPANAPQRAGLIRDYQAARTSLMAALSAEVGRLDAAWRAEPNEQARRELYRQRMALSNERVRMTEGGNPALRSDLVPLVMAANAFTRGGVTGVLGRATWRWAFP